MPAREAPGPIPTAPPARWSVAGLLLEAIASRDFTLMTSCFEPHAVMRALLTGGSVEYQGSAGIVAAFEHWFGDAQGFEVLDASVGDVGTRLHLSWRVRLHPTPSGDTGWHLVEQRAYVEADNRIASMDLLCSGFVPAPGG